MDGAIVMGRSLITRSLLALVLVAPIVTIDLRGQTPVTSGAQFEVVSIKKSATAPTSSSLRTLPDGGLMMSNGMVWSILSAASPEPVREVQGFPAWVQTERYDIVAKAPEGSARGQSREMIRNMLIDRFKLAGHVEQQARQTFALVVARRDGRLGPQLTPAKAECLRPPNELSPEQQRACGGMMRLDSIEYGAATMAMLAQSLAGPAGSFVDDHTGLEGRYAMSLHYTRQNGINRAPDAPPPGPNDPPDIFTALQEQLGLKLEPGKSMVPIFVIDHIERPTEN